MVTVYFAPKMRSISDKGKDNAAFIFANVLNVGLPNTLNVREPIWESGPPAWRRPTTKAGICGIAS